ncbi:MAG: hypothetical protein IJA15_07635, partial [Clostridia bacterium]|nr:hypothetical protein [Clostridia bacterium]
YGSVYVTGGKVIAHACGTGAAIGGGIGWFSGGGQGKVVISGGEVYAKNHALIYLNMSKDYAIIDKATYDSLAESSRNIIGGVAIGAGSSVKSSGARGTVEISGGKVEAYGTAGNAIGGGNSSSNTGGTAYITLSGGEVLSNTIGGGNSRLGVGGSAEVTVKNTANVTLTEGIGGGSSLGGNGGEATIIVENGIMNCAGVIGGGTGSATSTSLGNGGKATVTVKGGMLTAQAIGGGNAQKDGKGGDAIINVSGGTLNCSGAIGGGMGVSTGNGGAAEVTVTNGNLTAQSVGGGVGGASGHGGSAEIDISGGVIETGSIGGGITVNPSGNLGYAKAVISGGDIQGQFIMAAGGTEPCRFTMTGGVLRDVNTADNSKFTYSQPNGGDVYMNDPEGKATLSGGEIKNCSATNGGAVYMTAGEFTISGTGSITNCKATESGGAIYLGGGTLNVNGGSLTSNNALANGGAAFVNGGDVYVTAGDIIDNTASNNGGAVAINNGNYYMSGGKVDNNTALNGAGGAIYISAENTNVTAEITTGSVSGNAAGTSGGALAVVGKEGSDVDITVTVGVDEEHIGEHRYCDHNGDGVAEDDNCPVIKNNKASLSGGALYISGGRNTKLNTYCLIEEGSKAGSADEESRSDFMMVNGGKVIISTNHHGTKPSDFGNIAINSSIYVAAGEMDIYGSMDNPKINKHITVDIKKEGDYFKDHRENDPDIPPESRYYKLLYYENFKDTTGIVTGQYTEYMIKHGETVTISGSIYSHPGYEIIGWFTEPNGDGYKYEVGWDYTFTDDPSDYTKPGDLTIYAIWLSHYYDVYFESGIPQDVPYFGEEMEKKTFVYDTPDFLPLNTYIYPGYRFVNWYNKNDKTQTYTDGQQVVNLSSVDGAVITLVGNWKKCNHDGPEEDFFYTIEDNKLIRNCICNGYTHTATLLVQDAVYDGNEHDANVIYYQNALYNNPPSTPWNLNIEYSGENLGEFAVPTNAGVYTATISAGDKNLSLNYLIDKATQEKPDKPTYTSSLNTENNLYNIITIDEYTGYKKDWQEVEYRLAYYLGSELAATDWSKTQLEYELSVAQTNYFIQIRFAEHANYYPSDYTEADSTYFFAGDITLELNYQTGLHCYAIFSEDTDDDKTDNGIKVICNLLEGYYRTSDYNAQINSNNPVLGAFNADGSEYNIIEIPISTHIELYISGVAQQVTMDAFVVEGDIFNNVTKDSAHITRDSSFTAYFEAYNFYGYTNIAINFSSDCPNNTRIILIDKLNNTYWYYNAEGVFNSVYLVDFTSMGGTVAFDIGTSGEFALQFIVDFSLTSSGFSGNSLDVYLSSEKEDEKMPDFNSTTGLVSISVYDLPEFAIQQVENDSLAPLEKQYKVIFAKVPNNVVASKWKNKKASLVITPITELPFDAQIVVTAGTNRVTALRNVNGDFIISLPTKGEDVVKIEFDSKLFPAAQTTYSFNIKLMASRSVAGEAPLNGEVMATAQLTYIKPISEEFAVKFIERDNNNRVYQVGSTLQVQVNYNSSYTITLNLLFKDDNGGYSNTALLPIYLDPSENHLVRTEDVDVSLAGFKAGSFCLMATIKDETGSTVLTAPFYFVIVNS